MSGKLKEFAASFRVAGENGVINCVHDRSCNLALPVTLARFGCCGDFPTRFWILSSFYDFSTTMRRQVTVTKQFTSNITL
jgi:hypothetical protein